MPAPLRRAAARKSKGALLAGQPRPNRALGREAVFLGRRSSGGCGPPVPWEVLSPRETPSKHEISDASLPTTPGRPERFVARPPEAGGSPSPRDRWRVRHILQAQRGRVVGVETLL